VQLSLTAQTVKDALVVPASAIVTTPDGATVVMVAGADGMAHQTAVKVGIRNGDEAQILEGVSANDKVISSGAYGLPDKTKIKIEAAAAEPAESDKASDKAGGAKAPAGKPADKSNEKPDEK